MGNRSMFGVFDESLRVKDPLDQDLVDLARVKACPVNGSALSREQFMAFVVNLSVAVARDSATLE